MEKKQFIEGIHYYLDNGRVIMTEVYHKERGYCCGSGCKHCPYEGGVKGTTTLKKDDETKE
jgi:hypothetical protein